MRSILIAVAVVSLAACGTSPASDGSSSDDSGGTADNGSDVDHTDAPEPDATPGDVAASCGEAPGFPSSEPQIVFTGPSGAGAIPLDLIPLGDGVALATEHPRDGSQPGGHVLLVEPDGVRRDVVLGLGGLGPQIAAIDDDLLIAAYEEDAALSIERRDAEMDLVWELTALAINAQPRELVGGPNPGVLYTFQTGEFPTQSEFVRFGPNGEPSPISFRPRIENIRSVEMAANEESVAAVILESSTASPADFWMLDGEPRALHALSDRLSNTDPAIAWTGDEWAVVYQESESQGSVFELFVAFISADGSTVNDTVMVSEPGEHAVFPDIVAHPAGVTVVWQTGSSDGVVTRTIRPDRAMSEVTPVSTTATPGALLPLVAWTGERLVVAWASYTEELGYRGLVVFGDVVCP